MKKETLVNIKTRNWKSKRETFNTCNIMAYSSLKMYIPLNYTYKKTKQRIKFIIPNLLTCQNINCNSILSACADMENYS